MPVQFPIELHEQGNTNKVNQISIPSDQLIFGGEIWENDPLGSFSSIWTGTAWGIAHNQKPEGDGGLWVAVGDLGQIAYSLDGLTWVLAISPYTETLRDIAYDSQNDRWVIVGEDSTGVLGQIAYSDDGITWVNTGFNTPSGVLRGVSHNQQEGANGLWGAVGDSSEIYTSPDGIAWTIRVHPLANITMEEVIFGKELWIAVGDKTTILTSPDGITWTLATINDATNSEVIIGLAWNGQSGLEERYILSNAATPPSIWTSNDGLIWDISQEPDAHILGAGGGVDHGDGVFITYSLSGEISLSGEGQVWNEVDSDVIMALRSAAYDGTSRFVAVGMSTSMTTSIVQDIASFVVDLGTNYIYEEIHIINNVGIDLVLVPEEFNGDVSKGFFLHGEIVNDRHIDDIQRVRVNGRWNIVRLTGLPHHNTKLQLEFRGGGGKN